MAFLTLLLALSVRAQMVPQPAALIRLDELKNRNFRSNLEFALDGAPFNVSFIVARKERAYFSVNDSDGSALFNIRSLFGSAKQVQVQGRIYKISLSPSIFDQLGTKVVVTGPGEARAFTIRELMRGVYSRGPAVSLGGREYRVFFYDEIVDRSGIGSPDGSKRNVALVVQEKDESKYYLVGLEDIPSDKPVVRQLAGGARVGLQLQEGGSVLAIFPIP